MIASNETQHTNNAKVRSKDVIKFLYDLAKNYFKKRKKKIK